jgi:hypothetical protein
MRISEAQIIHRVQARLGAGRRCLELAGAESSGGFSHYQEAIDQTLDLFNQYINRHVFENRIDITDPQGRIDYSTDEDLLSVTNVEFLRPTNLTNFSELNIFGLTERALLSSPYVSGYGGGGPGRPISSSNLFELKVQQEMVQRVRNTEPDWIWDGNMRQLLLYIPAGPYEITVTKAYPHDLASLPENYKSIFLKAVEGYSRKILGDILGKFGNNIPGPTGSIENDAGYQRDQGTKLIEEVETYINKLPIMPGFFFG